jgi:dolichol-phosphate mannosyltransferase
LKIGVCITARNEEDTIGDLVRSLKLQGHQVYVGNDGSTDLTGWEAWHAGATVFNRKESIGIGPSLVQLWGFALEEGCTRIAQMDAGGSHNPYELHDLLEWGAFDVTIGSRFAPFSSYIGAPFRRKMSRLASFMCNLAYREAYFTDWTSGYRVFKRGAIERLIAVPYQAKMHGWQIETLAQAKRMGMNFREVPITYVAGDTSFNWKIALEAFRVWLTLLRN